MEEEILFLEGRVMEMREGYWFEIIPMLFGNYRIVYTDGHFVSDNW